MNWSVPQNREPIEAQRASWFATSKYFALLLLFFGSTLNLLDRQIIGILAELIKIDLDLSDAQLGLLTGSAFGFMYAFFTIPMSRLSDHVSRPRLVSVAICLWSLLTISCGMAANFWQLFLARMGVGIGEAGSQPASVSAIIDYFPPQQRGRAMAVFYLGVPVGGSLGLLLGAAAGTALGWREAFFFAGAPGILLSLTIWFCLRDPRRPDGASDWRKVLGETFSVGLGRAILKLLKIPAYRLLIIASIAGATIQNLSAAWLPVYFVRVQQWSMVETAGWMSAALLIAGTAGSMGSGYLCDRLRNRVQQPEILVLVLSLSLVFPALASTVLASEKPLAVAGLLATYLFAFAFLPAATLLAQKVTPEAMRGLALGLWASIMNVISLTAILPLIGLGSDIFTAKYGVRGLGHSIACAALIALAGAGVFALAGRTLARQARDEVALS